MNPRLPSAKDLTPAEMRRALERYNDELGRERLRQDDQLFLERLAAERRQRVNAGRGTQAEITAELISEGLEPAVAKKIATASVAARKATPHAL